MKIGLIAGKGQFPILFAKKAKAKGYEVFTIGFHDETNEDIVEYVKEIQWIYLGQVGKLIKYFKQKDVQQAVMVGSIDKIKSFKNIRPDLKAVLFISKNVRSHDNQLLTAFADLLLKEGIKIKSSVFLLPELLSPKGCWTKRKPSTTEQKDIYFAWKITKEVGRLDIGQCVVVSNGTIVAVEAIDGTDQTIIRGGRIANKDGAIAVKTCKPFQDKRFDLPSAGVKTIEIMKQAGVDILVLEAEKSITFDKEEMIKLADKYDICIVAYTDNDIK